MRKPRSPRPRSCTRIASQAQRLRRRCSPPRPATARGCARGCSQSVTPCRTPSVSPSQTKRSVGGAEADLRAGADGLHDRRLRPRRAAGSRRPIPPSSGEPRTWLISVRPRSCSCSIAKTHPFGRTLIDRPGRLAMRRRPRSLSRGVSKVRRGVISGLSSLGKAAVSVRPSARRGQIGSGNRLDADEARRPRVPPHRGRRSSTPR